MPERVLIIEDTTAHVATLKDAGKQQGLRMSWLQFDNRADLDGNPPPRPTFVDEFEQFLPTSDAEKAVAFLRGFVGDTLVLLDWGLGDGPQLEIFNALTRLIDESRDAGKFVFVQAYSKSPVGELAAGAIRRPGQCTFLIRPTDESIVPIMAEGIKNWRDAKDKLHPVPGRMWVAQAEGYFVDTHPAVPHKFIDGQRFDKAKRESRDYKRDDPLPYSGAIEALLNNMLMRPAPKHWLEGEQAELLHGSLMSVVGACSKAHGGRILESKRTLKTAQVNAMTRGLNVGGLVLLLAAATAPNNNWIDDFRWTRASLDEVTPAQTPRQAYRASLALVQDRKAREDDLGDEAGLFVQLAMLDGALHEGAVKSVTLHDGALRIALKFDAATPKPTRKSILQVVDYEDDGGTFMMSFRVASDALARSKSGYDPRCSLSLLRDPNGGTLLSFKRI